MPKRLLDGERKVINASRQYAMFKNKRFTVEAEREDSDTPFVHLHLDQPHITLTDVDALDLIDRLQRALAVLPSSK